MLAPIAAVSELSYGMIPKAGEDKEKPSSRPVGTVTAILGGKPYKVYAGEDYGDQSLGTYLKLRQANPNKFPEIKGAPKPPTSGAAAGKTPISPVTADWEGGADGATAGSGGGMDAATQGWGTGQDVNTGTYPAEVKTPGSEPGFDFLGKQFEKLASDEYLTKRTDEAIRQFTATTAISQALGAEKSRERYKREVELERIRRWTELQQTTLQSNLLAKALLGQAFISAQQPSAAMADVLAKGTQAAQGALGGSFQLKV
jgi:hypothetical protein